MRHHLVILHQQYIELILSGRKRIECRLSTVRKAPFQAVATGDLLWIKPPSKPVIAMASVGRCEFHELRARSSLERVIRGRRRQIAAQSGFFEDASDWAKYISLIEIESIVMVNALPILKRDQRAWIVLDGAPYPGMDVAKPTGRRIKVPSESRVRSSTQLRPQSPG